MVAGGDYVHINVWPVSHNSRAAAFWITYLESCGTSHSAVLHAQGSSSGDNAFNERPWMFMQMDVNARKQEGL